MLGDIPKEQISQNMEKNFEFKEEKPGQTPKQKRLAENVYSRSKDKQFSTKVEPIPYAIYLTLYL